MVKSVLLHLERLAPAEAIIRFGVSVASASEARLRGLTLVDTRSIESAVHCESAAYALVQHTRQAGFERQHEAVRALLSNACLQAGLDFDVRRAAGDPLHVLPHEAQFHDLVVASLAEASRSPGDSSGLSPADAVALLERGVHPLLLVHADQAKFERVLLVYDGAASSGRAIRSFLSLGIFTESEHRLLAIGRDEVHARTALREMADYCVARRASLETGCIAGRMRRVVMAYAEKWQADLVVLGGGGNRMLSRLAGNATLDLWRKLPCGLYLAS